MPCAAAWRVERIDRTHAMALTAPTAAPDAMELVIVGAGGHAREALDVVDAVNRTGHRYRVIGLLDDDQRLHGSSIRGHTVLGDVLLLATLSAAVRFFIGIGSCPARSRIAQAVAHLPHRAETLIHPFSSMGSDISLGDGCLVAPGVVVTTNVRLGRHTHLNSGSTVSHDCTLGDWVHIAPGAHIGGAVTIANGCDIGAGSTIIQGLTLAEWSVVGAGAAVVRDVAAGLTVVGVPARAIERNRISQG
jgi:sugar O-acyltransferase (sialic acid O-acetyltransferase NeuD family)